METWLAILLPFALVLARTAAFVAVLPIFGWRALSTTVRIGIALLLTIFFGFITPAAVIAEKIQWLSAILLLTQEIIWGLGLGLAARFAFLAVQQGGRMAGMQMGFADAGIFDPGQGERSRPVSLFIEMTFILFFLVAGGHQVLIMIIARSYDVLPLGQAVDVAGLLEALVRTGSTMLIFGLKLAAPILAAFILMAVVLAVLSKVLPEMNILMISFPIRIGMGLLMAAAIIPLFDSFASELLKRMNRFLIA